jgi:hypothetical protein
MLFGRPNTKEVARTRKMRNAYRYSVGTPEGNNHSGNLEVEDRIILKRTSKE